MSETEIQGAGENLELLAKNAADLLNKFKPEATAEDFEKDAQALDRVMEALGDPRSLGIFINKKSIQLVVCPNFQRELDQLVAEGSLTAQELFKKAGDFYGWDSAETPNTKGTKAGAWTVVRNQNGKIIRNDCQGVDTHGKGLIARNLMLRNEWTTKDGTAEDWAGALEAKTAEIATILKNDAAFKQKTQAAMSQLTVAVS